MAVTVTDGSYEGMKLWMESRASAVNNGAREFLDKEMGEREQGGDKVNKM